MNIIALLSVVLLLAGNGFSICSAAYPTMDWNKEFAKLDRMAVRIPEIAPCINRCKQLATTNGGMTADVLTCVRGCQTQLKQMADQMKEKIRLI